MPSLAAVMGYLGAAFGSGIFSVVIAYGLFKLLRMRELVGPWIAGSLAAAGSTAVVTMITASSGTSDPMAWLAAVAAPGAVVGATMAWSAERKRTGTKDSSV